MGRRNQPPGNVIPLHAPSLPDESEEAIALDFAEMRKDDLRYVAEQRRWMEWDGVVWRPDRVLAAYNSIRPLTRAVADKIMESGARDAKSSAASIANARTVAAVEKLARADQRLAATSDIWDSDPMLLGTPEGYVDLRTGVLHPARPESYLTRLARTVPDRDGRGCPKWIAFLDQITGGENELAAYLQRVAGYCLTGSTQEHALFFLLGTGRNGKSVFVNTLAQVMGDYAAAASMDMLFEAHGERHPTDLAMLSGARLASALETDHGRAWSETRVKQLTGGDPVTARFMRQDFFTYTPQFKLIIAGNKAPQIRSRDVAMRARIQFIPFHVTIPVKYRNKTLQTALLREEAPGILSWAIKGCLQWQAEGLAPPECVVALSRNNMGEEDPIERWVAECCNRDAAAKTAFMDLYSSWTRWAGGNSEFAGTEKAFATNLTLRGFEADRMPGGGAARRGISIVPRTTGPR